MTRGCCVSIRYRLAPQHPFPAALVDLVATYLSLLRPGLGCLHDAIPASQIVLAGDSAGANLCLSLVQLILQLHGRGTPASTIPLPAGVAVFSAWTDLTLSLPSMLTNENRDYFGKADALDRVPPCDVWPTDPPRGTLYTDISKLCHPLASPIIAEDWTGAPPMWFACGEEMLLDDSRVLAQRAATQDCTIVFTEYEAMPHCFQFLLNMPQTEHSLQACADFCRACTERPAQMSSEARRVTTSMEVRPLDVRKLTNITFDQVRDGMRLKMQDRARRFEQKLASQSKL